MTVAPPFESRVKRHTQIYCEQTIGGWKMADRLIFLRHLNVHVMVGPALLDACLQWVHLEKWLSEYYQQATPMHNTNTATQTNGIVCTLFQLLMVSWYKFSCLSINCWQRVCLLPALYCCARQYYLFESWQLVECSLPVYIINNRCTHFVAFSSSSPCSSRVRSFSLLHAGFEVLLCFVCCYTLFVGTVYQ